MNRLTQQSVYAVESCQANYISRLTDMRKETLHEKTFNSVKIIYNTKGRGEKSDAVGRRRLHTTSMWRHVGVKNLNFSVHHLPRAHHEAMT